MIRLIIISLLIQMCFCATGQDPQYSQFYANPSYINPGFVGTAVQHRFVANYRNQWPSIPGAFVSYNISYDNNFKEAKSGLGLYLSHDKAGSGGLTYTKLAGQYAYEIKLNRTTFIRPAVEYGMVWRYIDRSRLTFGDQLVRGGSFATFEFVEDQRINFFDIGTGAIVYTPRFWGGMSFHHINTPNQSLLGEIGPLPMKFGLQAGVRLPIKDFFGRHNDNFFVPALHYKSQGKFDQFDVGFYFERNPMTFGIWYRGIPGLKAYEPGYANNDALVILVGVRAKKVKIGYTYDITFSRLINHTAGAHEISIVYEYASLQETLSRTSRKIACPKF